MLDIRHAPADGRPHAIGLPPTHVRVLLLLFKALSFPDHHCLLELCHHKLGLRILTPLLWFQRVVDLDAIALYDSCTVVLRLWGYHVTAIAPITDSSVADLVPPLTSLDLRVMALAPLFVDFGATTGRYRQTSVMRLQLLRRRLP